MRRKHRQTVPKSLACPVKVRMPTPNALLRTPSQLPPMGCAAYLSVYGGLVPLGFSHSNFPLTAGYFIDRSISHFVRICNRQFKKGLSFLSYRGIIPVLNGETGERPVRVRRRKALTVFIHSRRAATADLVIGNTEKAG